MLMKLKPSSMQEEVFWRTRLAAAFRTAFGCFLAGVVLQLSNMHVQWSTFPIFAYVMAVTIVGESTFGKALQDTAGVLMGTIEGVGMAMLVLQLAGPERITLGVAILCISLSSLIIVYPQNTLIISKRVSLAHSAILYVTASIKRGHMDIVSFPLQLAGTTMVGAISGMLALLLPFPHLAMFQVQSQVKLSTRIISKRLRIMVDAFCINDMVKGLSLNLQAKSLAKIGSTVDAEIISKESDLGWELPGFSENIKHLIKGLKRLKEDLIGMEFALMSELSSPSKRLLHHMLKDCLIHLTDWVCLALGHASENGWKSSCRMQLIIDEGGEALASFDEKFSTARQKLVCMVSGEFGESMHGEFGESMHDVLIAGKPECDVVLVADSKKIFQFSAAALFFLFNLERFVEATKEILSNTDKVRFEHGGKSENGPQSKYAQLCDIVQSHIPSVPHDHGRLRVMVNNPKPCKYCYNTPNPSYQRAEQKKWYLVKYLMEYKVNAQQVRTAFKMSLAMAMGAFLGSWFSRTKGYWADITLGLGFTGASKGSSFKIAALRAQGTVAGSIYGLLVVLATKNFPFLRLVALIPWVVLTSFLRRSKLYGYAGAVSAFTGAIVILARTNKDSSDEAFTVVRIVEAFLGMTCFIIVEMLVMPSRAAAIVKLELISGLGKLKSHTAAVLSVFSESRCEKCCTIAVLDLKVREKSLKSLFARLKVLVKEATEEPQFWYAAFPANVYSKLMDAQTRMMDLLHFSVCAFETILKVFGSADMPVSELHGAFGSAMHVLEERVIPLLEFLEQALQANTAKDVNVKKPVLKSMTGDKKPSDDGQTVVELKNLIKTAGAAHASSNFPCSLSKMGPIKANLFMEEFEKSFHRLLGELVYHCSDDSREPNMEAFSNALLLSLGALAFSLEGLLREASELEKAVHELLQLESPWSFIDLWDSSSSSFKCREGQ